jgi:hypothetical protein
MMVLWVGFAQPPYGSRAPPPSYDEAVAHINDSIQDDFSSKTVQKHSTFPVHSVLTSDGKTRLYSNESFLGDTSQMYSETVSVPVPPFRRQTDHFIPLQQPSAMCSLAGDVCESSSLNFVDGQSLNGSAFREVPPSSHRLANSASLQCVQVSSARSLHQSGDDIMRESSGSGLLSPLTLFSSFTDNNEEQATQDCGDSSSNLSDIQPWRIDKKWQYC